MRDTTLKHLMTAALLAVAGPGLAASLADIAATRTILFEAVAVPTVKGRTGEMAKLANLTRDRLLAAGFAPADVTVTPLGPTAMLHAVWRGTGKRRPIGLAGHMDVVEADPKDWVRDPFTPVEEAGYLFGRGVADNKFDNAVIVQTLIALRREGFRPGRDIHLFLSGDEETEGKTAAEQAKLAKAANLDFVLNGDGGGGELGSDNKARGYEVQGAEKTYADFTLVVTDPGGHSSAPRPDNAIARLGTAAAKVAAYRFAPQANDLTRASLKAAGAARTDAVGAAMRAFAANPADAAAAATIAGDPYVIGQIATTCVPTMISGGHAPNALPQRAAATVNCRIFPGVPVAAVRAELERVVADPRVKVEAGQEWLATDASPLRPDVMAAVAKAVAPRGVEPVPGMSAGATDGVYYRALGIPVYGVSGLFMQPKDYFAHGLNERVPAAAIGPALDHWRTLITELAK